MPQEELVCDIVGLCFASATARGITNCIYCGKELHQQSSGEWFTWDAFFFTNDPTPQRVVG